MTIFQTKKHIDIYMTNIVTLLVTLKISDLHVNNMIICDISKFYSTQYYLKRIFCKICQKICLGT